MKQSNLKALSLDELWIALPFAMANAAIGIIDDAPVRCHKPLLVLAPAVRQKRSRTRCGRSYRNMERCKQRQNRDHHSHIAFPPDAGLRGESSGDRNDHVGKAKPRGPELVSARKQLADDGLMK